MSEEFTEGEWFDVDEQELIAWVFGTWYIERFQDPWAIGAGYGSKELVQYETMLWSREFFNLTRLPQKGEWIRVELMQDELEPPLHPKGEAILLIDEEITDELAARLTAILEKINRIQGLDFAEALCQVIHVYLFMRDWLRMKQGRGSCLVDLLDASGRKLAALEDVLDIWFDVREVFTEGFSSRKSGAGGMPSYRTIPHGWLSFDDLRALYEREFGDDFGRYPTVPLRVNLSHVPFLESGAYPANLFRREGDMWTISFEGRTVRLRDVLGLRYIAHLLEHAGDEFDALELVGIVTRDGLQRETLLPPGQGTRDELMDPSYMAQLRARLSELAVERIEAEGRDDTEKLEEIDDEVDAISQRLEADGALGGRSRRVADDMERARKRVLNRITDACTKILKAGHPPLYQHLSRHLQTGLYCQYFHPDPPVWTF